ncbi:DUF6361 family protein [Ruegeria aquimaris]|uniref:DUF6361 family protein n=1 Tax=Ruegeria aquimaris TaxID=2984333 RepID=A0ABT3APS2_9RHOB|nr:DUF6361 family protein [Ruegeria sp. XHP0148]MCV2890663.1 DUF6361 family protein [Ruegeria sp. XHP0148]
MSFLGWIDFDQADRDRTRRIIDLFGQEDTRDELGLGAIRDGLADLMFPGTSTIQTRLRYMLFTPWIYRMAGERNISAAGRRDIARGLEILLIDALQRGGETRGVIGSEAREKLKRLPSDVYWAGLWALGIRRFQGTRNACFEVPSSEAATLWAPGLPSHPENFLQSDEAAVRFALTQEEAGFLRDRLVQAAPDSLFTYLSRQQTAAECDWVWLHPDFASWPERLRRIATHAERFSRLMHGAALLYNLMLAEELAAIQGETVAIGKEKVEAYTKSLDAWREEIAGLALADWSLDDLWLLVEQTGHTVTTQARRFVESWRMVTEQAAGNVRIDAQARSLVRQREERLKNRKSRFINGSALRSWNGASGVAPFNYRWQPVVSDHLKDLADAG